MNLIVDTNIIISALIKGGKCREIITSGKFELFTPAYTLTEIQKYREEITNKADISYSDLELLLKTIFKYITIINPYSYEKYLQHSNKLMKEIDVKDSPFVAAALTLNCGIWSDDKKLKEQSIVEIFSTLEIADLS